MSYNYQRVSERSDLNLNMKHWNLHGERKVPRVDVLAATLDMVMRTHSTKKSQQIQTLFGSGFSFSSILTFSFENVCYNIFM